MDLLSFDIQDLPEPYEDGLRALLREAYEREESSEDEETGDDDGQEEEPFRVFIAVEECGSIVGGLLAYRRMAAADGVPFALGLIGSVATRKTHRGQGIATRLVLAAHDYFRANAVRYSVLFAFDPPIYRSMGYREIEAPLTYRDDDVAITKRVPRSMVCILSDHPWPEGDVDLMGGLV